eukprot:366119-Chlamydomonas_euryale.AAC.21
MHWDFAGNPHTRRQTSIARITLASRQRLSFLYSPSPPQYPIKVWAVPCDATGPCAHPAAAAAGATVSVAAPATAWRRGPSPAPSRHHRQRRSFTKRRCPTVRGRHHRTLADAAPARSCKVRTSPQSVALRRPLPPSGCEVEHALTSCNPSVRNMMQASDWPECCRSI